MVTGAARGQGAAIVRRLVADGYRVTAADLLIDELNSGTAEFGDQVLGVQLDVTSAEQWQAAVQATVDRFGGLNALVNNAGVLHRASIPEETPAGFESAWRVNCLGPFLGLQAALEPLRQAEGAAVVNTCSTGAVRPFPHHAAYGSSSGRCVGSPSWRPPNWAATGSASMRCSRDRSRRRCSTSRPRPDWSTGPPWVAWESRTKSPMRWRFCCPGRRRSSPVPSSLSTAANVCRSDDTGVECQITETLSGNHRRRSGWAGTRNLPEKAGFDVFTIFDREDGVGGTWRINTYPGLACDVKSHLYSYSFDLNADWSRLWAGQPEILEYFERCAERYRLGPHLQLNTEITAARWDADANKWVLTTGAGVQHRFDIVVSAIGLFTQPLLPDLPAEEPFAGTVMHTANWDHTVAVDGARVAVLGTGSTASQVVPEIAKVAEKVYSVQRSPTWVLPKPDRRYTERERWLFAHVPFAKKVYRTRLWLRSESNIAVIEDGSDKTQEFKAVALNLLESTVADEELRARLTPDHPLGCKRLVFSRISSPP